MKVGVITLMMALLFALPAWAGPDCVGADTDSDGHVDQCDNCDLVANPGQQDSDFDGYGNACDCDFDQDNLCAASDFLILGSNFNKAVPPCPAVVDMDSDLLCAASDFLLFGAGFNKAPGSSCTTSHTKGIPCPPPFGP